MDKNQNKINSKSFKYKTNEKNFRIFDALMQDKIRILLKLSLHI